MEDNTLTDKTPIVGATNESNFIKQENAVYSDLATTSRIDEPFLPEISHGGAETLVNGFVRDFSQPGVWLQYLYFVLAGIVFVALLLSVVIEWRKQHPLQIAYAGGLLAGMAILLYVHTILTGGATIV